MAVRGLPRRDEGEHGRRDHRGGPARRGARDDARGHLDRDVQGRRDGQADGDQPRGRGRAPPRAHADPAGRPPPHHGAVPRVGMQAGGGVEPLRRPPHPRRVAGPRVRPGRPVRGRGRELPRAGRRHGLRLRGRARRSELPALLRAVVPGHAARLRARPAAPQRALQRRGVQTQAGAAPPRAGHPPGQARPDGGADVLRGPRRRQRPRRRSEGPGRSQEEAGGHAGLHRAVQRPRQRPCAPPQPTPRMGGRHAEDHPRRQRAEQAQGEGGSGPQEEVREEAQARLHRGQGRLRGEHAGELRQARQGARGRVPGGRARIAPDGEAARRAVGPQDARGRHQGAQGLLARHADQALLMLDRTGGRRRLHRPEARR